MTSKKPSESIIVFTENYPFEKGEQFLINDYLHLSYYFDKFIVFPQSNIENQSSKKIKRLPENLIIEHLKYDKKPKLKLIFKNFNLLCNLFYHEVIFNSKRKAFLKDIKKNLALFFECIIIEENLNDYILKNNLKNSVFHSAWMNKYALVLSIAKYKKHINAFTFRVHGYDLFSERTKYNYISFENFNYKHTNKVILNSKYSYRYKIKQTPYKSKLDYNYFSIDQREINPNNEDIFHIVSCSSLIPLKRVHLIYNALKHVPFKVKWTHFGDGPEKLRIKNTELPENVNFQLRGYTENEKIHEFYKTTPLNLFIHTSETEGLGYAIFEALSFGIPCLVCNAGGTVDLVSDENGKLLPVDISAKALAKEILEFKNSSKNSQIFKIKVKEVFDKKYNTSKITSKFYNMSTL